MAMALELRRSASGPCTPFEIRHHDVGPFTQVLKRCVSSGLNHHVARDTIPECYYTVSDETVTQVKKDDAYDYIHDEKTPRKDVFESGRSLTSVHTDGGIELESTRLGLGREQPEREEDSDRDNTVLRKGSQPSLPKPKRRTRKKRKSATSLFRYWANPDEHWYRKTFYSPLYDPTGERLLDPIDPSRGCYDFTRDLSEFECDMTLNKGNISRKREVQAAPVRFKSRSRRKLKHGTASRRGVKSLEIDPTSEVSKRNGRGFVSHAGKAERERIKGAPSGARKGDRRLILDYKPFITSRVKYTEHDAPATNVKHVTLTSASRSRLARAIASINARQIEVLEEIQYREITPEDYELLLLLDESIEKKTLSPTIVLKLTSVTCSVVEKGEICVICQSEFEDGEELKVIPTCEHRFHKDCIEHWLLKCSCKCPVDNLQVALP